MKILHVSFTYYPDPVGGTEIYVKGVAEELIKQGMQCAIAAPSDQNLHYQYDGLDVYRYKVTQDIDSREDLYNAGDPNSAECFSRILDEYNPDIVNFHALTRGVSLLHIQEAKKRSIKVVFTYHTPTVSCMRGTMMRWGSIPCDGRPTPIRCTACLLHKHKIPKSFALGLALAGKVMPRLTLGNKFGYALQMYRLVEQRQQHVKQVFIESDQIVAVCQWVEKVILQWSINESKVSMIRQGLYECAQKEPSCIPEIELSSDCLNLAYFGRIDSTKGLELPIRAMQQADRKVSLHIFGIVQDKVYKRKLLKISEGVGNIIWHGSVEPQYVVPLMRKFNAIVIPSTWLETGPLVAYEAAAAGVPVIGHKLGGLAEISDQNTGNVLLDANIKQWKINLLKLNPEMFKPGKSVVHDRDMYQVSKELMTLLVGLR